MILLLCLLLLLTITITDKITHRGTRALINPTQPVSTADMHWDEQHQLWLIPLASLPAPRLVLFTLSEQELEQKHKRLILYMDGKRIKRKKSIVFLKESGLSTTFFAVNQATSPEEEWVLYFKAPEQDFNALQKKQFEIAAPFILDPNLLRAQLILLLVLVAHILKNRFKTYPSHTIDSLSQSQRLSFFKITPYQPDSCKFKAKTLALFSALLWSLFFMFILYMANQ